MQLPQENMETTSTSRGCCQTMFFLNQDPQIHKLCPKLKTDRWDYIKQRSIYTPKEITELRGKVQWAGEMAPCGQSAGYSSREDTGLFLAHTPQSGLHTSVTAVPGNALLASPGTRYTRGPETYTQAKHTT